MSLPMMDVWQITAMNLPEHARNPIHTDEGARAAGYAGALVAGVTTYAYLTRPAVEAWGMDWLRRGNAEVRFAAPVLAGDRVSCTPVAQGEKYRIDALVEGDARAHVMVELPEHPPAEPQTGQGDALAPWSGTLSGQWDGYGQRAGEDCRLYQDQGIVHPAVWPALANHVVHQQLAEGSWIHTRSRIQHHSVALVGESAVADAWVVDRFDTNAGERAVLDVRIFAPERAPGSQMIAHLEHEALIRLRDVSPSV